VSYTVSANTIGTGTAYYGLFTATLPTNTNSTVTVIYGTSTLVTATVNIGVTVDSSVRAEACLYWQSNSAVSVTLTALGTMKTQSQVQNWTGSVVTGLTTSSSKALAMTYILPSGGTGTIQTAYINQVH